MVPKTLMTDEAPSQDRDDSRATLMEDTLSREFPFADKAWPIVEQWAVQNAYVSYTPKESERRIFTKTFGIKPIGLYTDRFITVTVLDGRVRVEGFLTHGLLVRLLTLFVVPEFQSIEPGGWKAAAARKQTREEMSDLLKRFGQPGVS